MRADPTIEAQAIEEAQASLAEWYEARRSRIADERSARGIDQLTSYRDHLRRLVAGIDEAPVVRDMRTKRDARVKELAKRVRTLIEACKYDLARGREPKTHDLVERVERHLEEIVSKGGEGDGAR